MRLIQTDKAPAAVGPYSQGAQFGGQLLFTSGQLPVNMETGELETDVQKATKACLENVLTIVKEAGGELTSIAKVLVFVTDMNDFPKVNETYEEFFKEHKPARSCVEVAALPKGAVVEIEAIANV